MFGKETPWSRLLGLLSATPSGAEAAALSPATGTLLGGRYLVEERLGDGGAGVVFRGRDQVLDVAVAIKIFKPDGLFPAAEAREIQADLRAEARASMRLSHPNIARVHTYESDGPWEFLVMEFVDGVDLVRLRAARPDRCLPLDQVLRIGVAVADALDHAHRAGIVHNDIKPANLLIGRDGVPKVCDFGLAMLSRPKTPANQITGSPLYMPPERIRGATGTPAGDQYSLAATLFSLATGHAPFGAEKAKAVRGHLSDPVPTDDHLPASLDLVLRRALTKDPAARYPTAGDLRDALQAELAKIERTAAPPPTQAPPSPARKPKKRAPPKVVADPEGTVEVGARVVTVGGRDVAIRPFRIEVVPVTNQAWHGYVRATKTPPPAHWLGDRIPAGKERHPVVGITLEEARSYARWAGRRLPTEAEWTAVLRGPEGRSFPWGEGCDGTACQCPVGGSAETAPVDHHPRSATPEGVLDLLGNVWEWVEPDPRLAPPQPGRAIALGGSFRHGCPTAGAPPRTEINLGKAYQYVGFRCVVGE